MLSHKGWNAFLNSLDLQYSGTILPPKLHVLIKILPLFRTTNPNKHPPKYPSLSQQNTTIKQAKQTIKKEQSKNPRTRNPQQDPPKIFPPRYPYLFELCGVVSLSFSHFPKGDIGISGGMQLLEPANVNPTNVRLQPGGWVGWKTCQGWVEGREKTTFEGKTLGFFVVSFEVLNRFYFWKGAFGVPPNLFLTQMHPGGHMKDFTIPIPRFSSSLPPFLKHLQLIFSKTSLHLNYFFLRKGWFGVVFVHLPTSNLQVDSIKRYGGSTAPTMPWPEVLQGDGMHDQGESKGVLATLSRKWGLVKGLGKDVFFYLTCCKLQEVWAIRKDHELVGFVFLTEVFLEDQSQIHRFIVN